MKNQSKRMGVLVAVVALLGLQSLAMGQVPTYGFNLDVDPGPPIFVEFDPGVGHWQLDLDITFDPSAGPMIKHFQSPMHVTGAPIQLDAQQPFPQPVWENFPLRVGEPVSDWHEEILTPGWVWDPSADGVLITRDGIPWDWKHMPMPGGDSGFGTPYLWVEFPPIKPGHVLDVHKQLLWVGTPGNRIWGDGVDDSGNNVDENFIEVLEYPTPEPATLMLLGVGGVMAMRRRRG